MVEGPRGLSSNVSGSGWSTRVVLMGIPEPGAPTAGDQPSAGGVSTAGLILIILNSGTGRPPQRQQRIYPSQSSRANLA